MTTHKSNNQSTTAIAALIAVAVSFQYSPPLSAQEEAGALEEVIVTASRREESLKNVALAVTVLDVGKYADAGLTNLADVMTFVPGVSVEDSGAPFFPSVYMRGINATLSAGVASYVDDIPFGSSTVYTSSAPLDGTLLDLATLDVLKGPQGTLLPAGEGGRRLTSRPAPRIIQQL